MTTLTNIKGFLHCLVLLVSLQFTGTAASPIIKIETEADAICGVWFTKNNNSKIEIYREGGQYHGRIIWLKNKSKGDYTNAQVISKMVYNQSDKQWEKGTLHYPVKNENYQGIIELNGRDTLVIRAFLGTPVFGKTITWVRSR